MKEAQEIYQLISEVCEAWEDKDEIAPTGIANKAMQKIQATKLQQSHPIVYLGCHLEFRQIARQILRRKFEPTEREAAEDESMQYLFEGNLQRRYPRAKTIGNESLYVKRELMSKEDVAYNVARLRKFGNSFLKHADALEAWGEENVA